MRYLNLTKNIYDANASGRGLSSAPWNNYDNTTFNSKEVQKENGGQSGRSMIEMLGVLAIIGVLSVGGIAGYSKAMHKYRVNKTIEQITLIAQNIRTFFSTQNNYSGTANRDVLRKAKLIPEEMLSYNDDGTIKIITDAWGNSVNILNPSAFSSTSRTFTIKLANLSEEACIDLVTHDWPDENIAIMFGETHNMKQTDMYFPEYECTQNSITKSASSYRACRSKGDLPISVDGAVLGCQVKTSHDVIVAYFHFE